MEGHIPLILMFPQLIVFDAKVNSLRNQVLPLKKS